MKNKTAAAIIACIFISLYLFTGCNNSGSSEGASSTWKKIDWKTADSGAYANFKVNGLSPSCSNAPGTSSSDFYFFARTGSSNNLVIFFKGGGACWHKNNCITYSTVYNKEISETVDDLESATWNVGGSLDGIFDITNEDNPFRDWSMVYIPYCTGDLGWGAGDKTYDGDAIRHRGHVNFRVALEWITEHFESPDEIMVCGTSAGAFNAAFNFPFIKESFRDSQLYLIGDSGIGVVTDEFRTDPDNGIVSWSIQPPTTDTLPDGSTFDDFNSAAISDITMSDIYIAIANHYDDAVIGQYTTEYDTTMTMFYNMMIEIDTPANWANYSGVWCDWVSKMHDILDEEYMDISVDADNFHYYIAPGKVHTILKFDDMYTMTSNSTALLDWINAMMDGGSAFNNVACTDCEEPDTETFPSCP
ncbi:MAG TPA: pectin acetylesterase-family hydrolase [Spirochaetota bacterium]|nr:pectin acetylesterase-family hydrolase [Spirochaetota bacterium]HPR49861.1 pectin acetylesterase-family hydrolase [Spirochaetota bacterium]